MIVRVLGSAAGGGVPQWNCACPNCVAARQGRAPRRTESTVAVSPQAFDGRLWLLLNCSPDIGAQIESFTPLQPPHGRFTPIRHVLLTDANLDHIGGLAVLRQTTTGLYVRSTAAVRTIAAVQPSFAHFSKPPNRWLEVPLGETIRQQGDDDWLGDFLSIRAIPVSGTTPGYDGRRSMPGAVVAYEIADSGSRERLLFAPVFGGIDDALGAAIESAAVAFLDGTFYSDDELQANGLGIKRAREMGHQPVGGPYGTLAALAGMKTRVIFTHLNNSNPMLDSESAAFLNVHEAGGELAFDGMELTL